MYADFDLEIPDRLEDALAMLAEGGDEPATPLAGGTNLIVDIRAKRERPKRVVSLDRLHKLRGISNGGARLTIGGGTTVTDLLESAEVEAARPSLVEAARVFGGQMVRNAATVAGNIAYGSPAADLVPPLLALDAEVTLASVAGERTVPLDAYYRGYKDDVRRADELITKVSWERPPENSTDLFCKLGRRKGDAITVTGVSVMLAASGRTCTKVRIALGAVAPVILRAKKAEALLEGETLTADLIDQAGRLAAAECDPIDDVRASGEYRAHTVHMLTRRLIAQAWATVG